MLSELSNRLYRRLQAVAAKRELLTYGEVGAIVNLSPRDPQLYKILDEICEYERAAGRPLLSVIVVRKDTGMPGLRFFEKYGSSGESHEQFFSRERNRVYQAHASSRTEQINSGLVAETGGNAKNTALDLWQGTDRILHTIVETVLKKKRGDSWRKTALPDSVQKKVMSDPKHVLSITDRAVTIRHHWELFSRYFDRTKIGKNRALEWLFRFNDIRRRLAHPHPSEKPITSDEVACCQWCHEEARKILAAVETTSSAKVQNQYLAS